MTAEITALSLGSKIRAAQAAMTTARPAGVASTRSHVSVDERFELRVTDHLSFDCGYAFTLLGQTRSGFETTDGAPRMNAVSLSPRIAAARYDYDKIEIHIPEAGLADAGAPADRDTILQRLAFGAGSPDTVFPIDEPDACRHHDDIGSAMAVIHTRTAAAIDWLLGRHDGSRVVLDLDRVLIDAGSDIYDGHGRLMAFPMRLRHEDVTGFAQAHGEDALRAALSEGHLYLNGGARLDGDGLSEARIDKTCDRIMGRDSSRFGFAPYVAWQADLFESVVRPHLGSAPFGGRPEALDHRRAGLMMLEAALALTSDPPAPGPA